MSVGFAMSMLILAILIVVVLCVYFKIHAFVSLMTACLFLALTMEMPLAKIVSAFETGLGERWASWRRFWRWGQYSAS